jgi:hypothetical protein
MEKQCMWNNVKSHTKGKINRVSSTPRKDERVKKKKSKNVTKFVRVDFTLVEPCWKELSLEL